MIVVIGESLIDLIQDEARPARFEALPGGSQFNCALALGRLGAPVRFSGPFSRDGFGALLRDTAKKSGVEALLPRSKAPTSLAVVTLKNGQPSYEFYREGTAEREITRKALLEAMPANAEFLQCGSLTLASEPDGDVVVDVAETAAARGTLVTLDPNVRPTFIPDMDRFRARLERVARTASLMKTSDEDAALVFPGEAPETLRKRFGLDVLVLTRGAEGAVLVSDAGRVEIPAVRVEGDGDTVGAGDTFMAGLIRGLHARHVTSRQAMKALGADELRSIGAFAATAAGIICSRRGANPPTLAEVEARLQVR